MVSLALYSSTVTRKPLDKLQTAFFGKISGGEWVKQSTKFFEKIHFQYLFIYLFIYLVTHKTLYNINKSC